MQSRQLTKNTDVNFVPLISNTRVGQKKIKVINLVTKKTKGPSFFPSPNHKKIIIQKGKNHCPTTTPTNFVTKKNTSLFPVFSRHRLSPHETPKIYLCVVSQKQSNGRDRYTTLQLPWLVSSSTSITYALF